MKPGKLSQTVWRRSVRKQLNTDSKVILLRPSAEEMCTAMQVSEGEAAVSTSATVSGSSEYLGIYAVAKALNDLATRGAKPVSIAFQILLPEDTEEEKWSMRIFPLLHGHVLYSVLSSFQLITILQV